MAMGFEDVHDLAEHPRFRRRVKAAVVKAAVAVGAEEPAQTQRAMARRALSVNVLGDPGAYLESFSWAVATNSVITLASSDSDLEFTVNSVWDAVAGAEPAS